MDFKEFLREKLIKQLDIQPEQASDELFMAQLVSSARAGDIVEWVQEFQARKPFSATMTMMFDNVLVLPDEPEEKTKAGVFIPDTAKKPQAYGTVILVGPGIEGAMAPAVKQGDKVIFKRGFGTKVSIEDGDYLMMRDTDIIAIF